MKLEIYEREMMLFFKLKKNNKRTEIKGECHMALTFWHHKQMFYIYRRMDSFCKYCVRVRTRGQAETEDFT